jgi:phosphoadenosine phosphosulfate reductase
MKYNPLYDKGFYRVGCIGCPLAGNQVTELEMYPKYKNLYILAFQKMVDKRTAKGKVQTSKYGQIWKDGESVYKWWIQDYSDENQMNIFDYINKEEN